MIQSFADPGSEDVYEGRDTKRAARSCPRALWPVAGRKMDQLDAAQELTDLRLPPGNRLEALSGDRSGQYSIRVNQRYRICFRWTDAGPADVEITDYH
jgi:proteic killer suppression protein